MKGVARLIAIGLTSAALSGCTLFDWRSGEGSEENWQDAYLAREAQFTLRDGTVETISVPRDYGQAVCAFLSPCIAKSDIVSVRWYRQTDTSRSAEFAGEVVAAAILFPYTAAVLLDAATRQPLEAPPLPPDWSYIPDSCGDREASVRVVIQDLQAAAHWAEENRWSLGWFCLRGLSRTEALPLASDMAVELATLGEIRQRWDHARCANAKRDTFSGITTSHADPTDPRRGPPGYFDLVTRLLRDPRSWDYATDLAEVCQHQGGVLPESAWPERKTWMRTLHPFPPEGFEEIFP